MRIRAASGMGRCLDAVRDSLADAARSSHAVAARLGAQDALDRLEQCRAAMQSSFPALLDQAIAEALDTAGDQPAEPRREPGALPGDTELALLDESELSHFVETARLVQVVQPVVARALARLDSLMSSALQQPVVRPDLNPMRPEVLCRALMRMLDAQSGSTEVRRLWLRHIAKSYAGELNDLYRVMSDWLEREGMHEAHYRVKLTEGGVGPVMGAGGAAPVMPTLPGGYPVGGAPVMPGTAAGGFPAGAAEPAGEPASPEDLSDEQAIRRRRAPAPPITEPAGAHPPAPRVTLDDFLHGPQLPQSYDAPLPQDYYTALQRQLAQLAAAPMPVYDEAAWQREQARMGGLAAVDRPARAVTPQMPLSPRQWGQQAASPLTRERAVMALKAQATRISQALGINAVRALVAQVVADESILAPVREAVVVLEPALLRLALAEPRFFGDGEHPARRLIEEIIQRGFKYNDEFAPDFETFIAPVRQAVRALGALAEPADEDFDRTLRALQADWQEQDEAEQQAREQGRRAMEFAQQRQQMADRIARDLSQRSDLAGVPRAVADFLFKDWSLVIAHAQLRHGQRELDPGGYLSIVTDLLWSVKRTEILHDLTRLFEVVPRVVVTLRKGQAMLGKEAGESQALLDMLLRFHEPVLKLRRMRSAIDKGATLKELTAALQLPEEKDLVKPGQAPQLQAAAQPWLSRREREATGFMDDDLDSPDLVSRTGQAALEGETAAVGTSPAIFAQPLHARQHTGAAAPGRQEADAETVARAAAQLIRLRPGDWVDLRAQRQWRRAELAWISDNDALYLFVSPDGRVHSMTRQTLEKLLRSGHVRPLESGAVVDKALKAIAAHAGREQAAAGYTR